MHYTTGIMLFFCKKEPLINKNIEAKNLQSLGGWKYGPKMGGAGEEAKGRDGNGKREDVRI
jgi:hypothetical protein